MRAINLFKVFMPVEVDNPLLNTLHSGFIGQGKKVEEYEQRLKSWLGSEYVLATITGTAAIHIALRLAGAGPETSVVSTPYSCLATNLPILHSGARIIWADVDPLTGLIDPEDVERQIYRDTVAIMCLDWGGTPSNLGELKRIAKDNHIALIEDACQAFGSWYNGQPIGTIADYTCFSTQAVKVYTTCEGGILTVRDEADYEEARLLRWYGLSRDCPCYEQGVVLAGDKWNFNDLLATIGIASLDHVGFALGRQYDNAQYYLQEFEARQLKHIKPIYYASEKKPNYWLFTLLCDDRSDFIKFMAEHRIEAGPVHGRNDVLYIFREFQRRELPGTAEFAAREVCIPNHYGVSEVDRKYIMDCVEKWDRSYK